jgi:ribosomal-protein-alanine N-acetyltransferase
MSAGAAPVTISPLRRRHLRGVLRIENRVYPTPWSMGLYLAELAAPTGRTYKVARRRGGVVGYGGVMYVVDEAHVTTLAVHPDERGQGIGARILLALVRAARQEGMTSLTLEVRAGNRAAQGLYRRFGLAPAGVRRGYYKRAGVSGPGEDAVVMWAQDIDGAPYGARLDTIEAELVGDPTTSGPA